MARKLKSGWLPAFMEWSLPRSEAPESMLRWAGLFALSAVVKRKVWWPERLMGGYTIYPNLYVVFVGDPAVVRKSTTVGFSERLLVSIEESLGTDQITFAGDVTSHSKLLEHLSNSPDSSVAIVSSEFSSLIQTTPEQMYELLTDIFDNKRKVDWATWAHGNHEIKNPVVNLIAATTPAWISAQPPEYFVGGGFASRILFVYEEAPRQREIYYDHLDYEKLEKIEKDLAEDLVHISLMKGPFTHDSKRTKEYCRQWYLDLPLSSSDPRLKGYHGRKHTHAHKIAGLFSLSERDDRKITRQHFDEAVKMLDYVEMRMSQAFSTLGTNPFTRVMDSMVEYLQEKESATLQQLAGRFYTEGWTLDQLRSALSYLTTTGQIRGEGTTTSVNPTYHFVQNR